MYYNTAENQILVIYSYNKHSHGAHGLTGGAD